MILHRLGHALGIVFYDGPIYIDSSYFIGFKSSPNGTFAAGAFGFNPRNKFSSSVVSNVTNIRFGFVDKVCSILLTILANLPDSVFQTRCPFADSGDQDQTLCTFSDKRLFL